MLIVAGCSTSVEDVSKAVEKATETNVAGEVEQVSPAKTQDFEAPMTEEEALIVAEDIWGGIYNLAVLLYDDSGEVTEPNPETMDSLTSYATERFIEERVILHDDLCGTPCYTIDLPAGLNHAWQPVVQFTSADKFSVTSLHSTYDEVRQYSYEQTVLYQFDGDNWLMDTFDEVEKDMSLTEVDSKSYLELHHYSVDEIGEMQAMDVMGQEELVYPFTEIYSSGEYFIVGRTGYIFSEDGAEVAPSEDDLAYWWLFYPWSGHWDEIDTTNPIITDFYDRVVEIDNRIYVAYEAEDGLEVAQEMLADYNASHEEIYEIYSVNWDDAKREEYEMENRSWYFYYVNSLSDYIPAEATDVEAVLIEAEAVKNRIYSILVNEPLL